MKTPGLVKLSMDISLPHTSLHSRCPLCLGVEPFPKDLRSLSLWSRASHRSSLAPRTDRTEGIPTASGQRELSKFSKIVILIHRQSPTWKQSPGLGGKDPSALTLPQTRRPRSNEVLGVVRGVLSVVSEWSVETRWRSRAAEWTRGWAALPLQPPRLGLRLRHCDPMNVSIYAHLTVTQHTPEAVH